MFVFFLSNLECKKIWALFEGLARPSGPKLPFRFLPAVLVTPSVLSVAPYADQTSSVTGLPEPSSLGFEFHTFYTSQCFKHERFAEESSWRICPVFFAF